MFAFILRLLSAFSVIIGGRKMMILQTVFFLWLYFPLARSNEQPDCSSLGLGTNAFSGSNLPYCQTDMLQCCTEDYLREKEAGIRMSLRTSLKEELLRGNFEIFSQIVTDLENFYSSDFFPDFASKMPLMIHLSSSSRTELINSFSNNLREGLNSSNNFNYGPYFDGFFNMVKDRFIDDYLSQFTFTGTINTVQKNCLRTNLLTQRTNSTLEQTIDTKMDKLLLYYTTTNRIKDWYEKNFIALIEQTGFPSQCLPGFITLECAACFQTIPPLCQSVCSHLTQGCYSPFKQGLADQLNILWNATGSILDKIESTLPEVYSAQVNLLPIDFNDDSEFNSFASAASNTCGILLNKNIGRRRRSLNSFVMLPRSIVANATLLNGSFSYDGRLPHFCNSSSGGRCWNGNNNNEMDILRTDFDDSIENQDLNPVVSFNRTELVEIAQSLGTPVSNFLESALTGLDLEVPMGEVFQLMIEERPTQASSVTSVIPTVSESLMISATSTSSAVRMSTSSTYHFPSPTTNLTATDGGSLHYCSFYMILIFLAIFMIA